MVATYEEEIFVMFFYDSMSLMKVSSLSQSSVNIPGFDTCLNLVAVTGELVYALVLSIPKTPYLIIAVLESDSEVMRYSSRVIEIPLNPLSEYMSSLIVSTTKVYVWGVSDGFGET